MTGTERVDILLVEDNRRDVELVLRALKKHNLANRVTVVTDGEQALDFVFARGAYAERAEGPKPRAIVLDLKLPKLGGIEVLQQIRSDERTRLLPVVIMTSSQEERDIVDAYKLGVNSYVVKPMDFEQFAQVVAELGYYWVAINKTPT